jgi:BirA family biotin operon repressor/biotin-[acetyl-CoA-carboxylase] ligase
VTAAAGGDRLKLLAIPAVRSALERELGRAIEWHEQLASTQDRARELASAGADPTVIVADEQTAGHGRGERRWLAPAGAGLLASWIFRPPPAGPALFSVLAGVAVARALEALEVREARLKWPNDVQMGGKKVAGTLAHATTGGEDVGAPGVLVLGIGVNVHQGEGDFPPELRGGATSLAAVGKSVDRLALLARLTAALDRVARPEEHERAIAEWRSRATLLGREVRIELADRSVLRGRAADLAPDGALVIETAAGRERVVAGEVSVLE